MSACQTCGWVHPSDWVRVIDRFRPDGPAGYRSVLNPAAALRATREEAMADACATKALPPLVPLPDLPGKVHGIVSLDPPTVQCDGCLVTYSHEHLGMAVMTSGILFNPRRDDRRRLCRECAREAGWAS